MPKKEIDLPYATIPYVSILNEEGKLDEGLEPDIPKADLKRLFRTMVLSREYDQRRLKLQRQGRIGTFAPAWGQEAAQVGSAYCLKDSDWFVPSFREVGIALWRGMKLENDLLWAAGVEEGMEVAERDMPVAIPIASQVCHAVGLAWGSRLQGRDDVAVVYFGDGATSHGDFHEGANFAPVVEAPLVLFCQNNQYAISVPRAWQTASGTLAQKAIAYGMPGIQVDGNDILAVIHATAEAVARARAGKGPTLIEAVTYRMSVHTTADDPSKYRSKDEEEVWAVKDPITRFNDYLVGKGVLAEDEHAAIAEEVRLEISEAVKRFEERLDEIEPGYMFEHNMAFEPVYLKRQAEAFPNDILARGTRRGGV